MVDVRAPTNDVPAECKRVLRTLPKWFGIEESFLEYARNTSRLSSFVAEDQSRVIGFISLKQHFPGPGQSTASPSPLTTEAKESARVCSARRSSGWQRKAPY